MTKTNACQVCRKYRSLNEVERMCIFDLYDTVVTRIYESLELK